MHVKALEVGYLQTNCYVVSPEEGGLCALIDPGGDSGLILDYLESQKLCCGGILLTHGHFDHCTAVPALLEELGEELPLCVCRRDVDVPADPRHELFPLVPPKNTVYIDEGDVITVGELRFSVLATPGHSPGSVCFAAGDCLFTGDTLFRLSCGRTDFPGGSASGLRRSLRRLRNLTGNPDVYPGHMGQSTLDYERRFNPCLEEESCAEY